MRAIPPKLRQEMSDDPYYSKCCLAYLGGCSGRVEWHHNLIFGNRQQNFKWCILPVCHAHHEIEKRKDIGEQLDWIMLSRASVFDLIPFCKAIDYVRMRDNLIQKYGNYNP